MNKGGSDKDATCNAVQRVNDDEDDDGDAENSVASFIVVFCTVQRGLGHVVSNSKACIHLGSDGDDAQDRRLCKVV